MRLLSGVLALFFAGLVQAAPVTIDFEELAVGTQGPIETKGFTITGFATIGGTEICIPVSCGVGAVTSLKSFSVLGIEDFFTGFDMTIEIERTGGGAFSLLSLEGSGVFGWDGATVQGVTSGGSAFSETIADLGSGQWLDITSATLYFSAPPLGSGFSYAGGVDNIVVNVVPIPAAVWLFASGLGLLGFMRSR